MESDAGLDVYAVLGLGRQASAAEVSRAYRRAARATHPDSRPRDPSASERFQAVSAAYEILRDPRRRAAYDRVHPASTPAPSHPLRSSARPTRLGGFNQPLNPFPAGSPPGQRPTAPLWAGPVHVAAPAERREGRSTVAGPELRILAALRALGYLR